MINFKEWLFIEAAIGVQSIQYNNAGYPNFRIKIKNNGAQLMLE